MPSSHLLWSAWACLALALGLHFTLRVVRVVAFPYTLTGVVLVGVGMAFAAWTESVMKNLGTPLKPHAIATRLATSGPFRVSGRPDHSPQSAGKAYRVHSHLPR